MIKEINKWEEAVVMLLNLDGWNLKHTGKSNESWDAIGTTPKGLECVIEMKFRKKHYETKMLEKDKYDALMALDKDVIKIYLVNDAKGNFLFYLNNLEMPPAVKKYCPDTTMWTKKRLLKEVYLIDEKYALRINLNKGY